MSLALAVLPLLLVIAAGYVLARTGVLPPEQWKGIETLSFRVLIPAILILAITRTDLSWEDYGGFMLALMTTFCVVVAVLLMLRLLPQARLGNPQFTSIFQTGLRWNAFVALAAAEQFSGTADFAALAVAIALLIPSINITCILVLSACGTARASFRGVLLNVLKNPLVQACLIGLAISATGVTLPRPVVDALDMVGRGALAVGLLAVGAGISLRRLARWNWQVGAALLMRPVLAPSLFYAVATVAGLDALQTLAGVLVFAAPAASNGYIVARQMGGDADLYADVLTWQVLLSLVVLPIWAWALLA